MFSKSNKILLIVAFIAIACNFYLIFKHYLYEQFLEIPEVSLVPRPYEYLENEVRSSQRPDDLSLDIARKSLNNVFSIQDRADSLLFPEISVELDSLWHTDRVDNGRWFYNLHSLFILYDIIISHELTGNAEFINAGEKIIRSWVKNNPRKYLNPRLNWNDHVAANRSVAICAFIDYLNYNDLLNNSLIRFIIPVLLDHGVFLSSHLNYFYSQNHGIFEDYALLVISTHISKSKLTEDWIGLLKTRIDKQIEATYSSESINMENSAQYHFYVTQLLDRMNNYFRNNNIIPPERLSEVIPGAKAAYYSFIMPNGIMVPFGDTPRNRKLEIPDVAVNDRHFTVYPDVGYAIVRGPYYIFMAASNRSLSHKHRDDLSFILADINSELLTDPGLLNYTSSPENRYTVTWQGHNAISEDRRYTYFYTKVDISQECGVINWGNDRNKIFIKGYSLRRSGFLQIRHFYYDIDLNLIIIQDVVRNNKGKNYYKYFHLPPESQSQKRNDFAYMINDSTVLSFWPNRGEVRSIKGQKDPLQGWVAVPFRGLIPATALEHSIPGNIVSSATCINDISSGIKYCKVDSNRIEVGNNFYKKVIRFSDNLIVDSTETLGRDTTISVVKIEPIRNENFGAEKKIKRYGVPIGLKERLMISVSIALGWLAVLFLVFVISDRRIYIRFSLISLAVLINLIVLIGIRNIL
jgi:hypothetical protein